MQVNTALIKALNPCAGRFANYLKHYEDFDGQLENFFALPLISYHDKTWVAIRLMTFEQYCRVAALRTQAVVHLIEQKHNEGAVLRQKVERVLRGLVTSGLMSDDLRELHSAASAADRTINRSKELYAATYATFCLVGAVSDKSARSAYLAVDYATFAECFATGVDMGTQHEQENLQLMLDVVRGVK